MTYQEAFTKTKREFEAAGIREPGIDARLLLLHVTGLSSSGLFLRMPDEMPEDELRRLDELAARRAKRCPLQYIIGTQGFYGLSFKVGREALIPRADTEILVEEAQKHLCDGDELLDICTGTGCVLISLMKNRRVKRGVGADISKGALLIAEENARRLRVSPQPEWILGDFLGDIKSKYKFNLITANPPYIDTQVLEGLQPEIREYEPREALDGGKDGLRFYRPLAEWAAGHIVPGGWFVTEIGFDQGRAVREIFQEAGFENVQVIKDLASDDRVVKGQYNVRQA